MAVLLDVELSTEIKEVRSVFLILVGMRSIRTVGVAQKNEAFVKGPKTVESTGKIPPILLSREI